MNDGEHKGGGEDDQNDGNQDGGEEQAIVIVNQIVKQSMDEQPIDDQITVHLTKKNHGGENIN